MTTVTSRSPSLSLPGPSLLLCPQATPEVFPDPARELAFPGIDWGQTQGASFTLRNYFETHPGVRRWVLPSHCQVVVYGMNMPPFVYPLTRRWVGDVSRLRLSHRCSDEHILHFSWVNKYLGVE